jgi:ubiquinone/menaquinone biosynthesis C-methylase UbiE
MKAAKNFPRNNQRSNEGRMKANLSTSNMFFSQMSKYWIEIADAHLTINQIEFVKNSMPSDGLVLDLCCGHGRHAIPLSKAGYSIVGLDISRNLLNIAKSAADDANIELPLVLADMRFLPFRHAVFSAVISLDSSFGYLPSETEDLKSFHEISRILATNGICLVDLFNEPYLIEHQSAWLRFKISEIYFKFQSLPEMFVHLFQWREYSTFYLHEKNRVNSQRQIWSLFWVFCDKKRGIIRTFYHFLRLYNLPQIRALMQKARLQVTATFGNYNGANYNRDSKRLILKASNLLFV